MYMTKTGNQCYFGVKAHICVDSRCKLIHSVTITAANVHYRQLLGTRCTVEKPVCWGDSIYSRQREALRSRVPPSTTLSIRKDIVTVSRVMKRMSGIILSLGYGPRRSIRSWFSNGYLDSGRCTTGGGTICTWLDAYCCSQPS